MRICRGDVGLRRKYMRVVVVENKAEKNIGFGRVLGSWPYFPDFNMLTMRGGC